MHLQGHFNESAVAGVQLSGHTTGPLVAWSYGKSDLLCTDVTTTEFRASMELMQLFIA
jgi:hypothetical protein